jgi:hypothetical protein
MLKITVQPLAGPFDDEQLPRFQENTLSFPPPRSNDDVSKYCSRYSGQLFSILSSPSNSKQKQISALSILFQLNEVNEVTANFFLQTELPHILLDLTLASQDLDVKIASAILIGLLFRQATDIPHDVLFKDGLFQAIVGCTVYSLQNYQTSSIAAHLLAASCELAFYVISHRVEIENETNLQKKTLLKSMWVLPESFSNLLEMVLAIEIDNTQSMHIACIPILLACLGNFLVVYPLIFNELRSTSLLKQLLQIHLKKSSSFASAKDVSDLPVNIRLLGGVICNFITFLVAERSREKLMEDATLARLINQALL